MIVDVGAFNTSFAYGEDHTTFDFFSGEQFDTLLTIDCIAKFKRKTTIDISRKAAPVRRLRIAAEKLKRKLSIKNYTVIRVKNLAEEENFEKSYT